MSSIGQEGADRSILNPGTADRLICLCLFLVAPVFALTSMQLDYTTTLYRSFSVPVMVCQLAIIALAFSSRVQPLSALREMPRLVMACIGLWFIGALISTMGADLQPTASMSLARSLLQLVFGLALYGFIRAEPLTDSWPMLKSLAWGLTVYTVVVLVFVLIAWDYPGMKWERVGVGVSSVRTLGTYGVVLAGIGLGASIAEDARAARYPLIWTTAGLTLVFLSGGRAPFAGVLAALVVTFIIAGAYRRLLLARVAIASSIAAIPGLLIVPHPFWGLQTILSRGLDIDNLGDGYSARRWEIWIATLEVIKQRPVFGFGEGQYRFHVIAANPHPQPHNVIMQVLFEWGIIGASAIAVATISGVHWVWRQLDALPRHVAVALPVVVGILGNAMFDGALFFYFPVMFFVVALACMFQPTTVAH